MIRITFIILLLCCGTLALSQNFSDGGNASVPVFESCVGSMPISAPLCDGSIVCQIDFPDGTFQQFDDGDIVTFNTPGDIEIEITLGAVIDHLQIKIYPDVVPTFNLYACDGYQVSLDITDNTYPNYQINYTDGTGPFVATTGTQPVHTYPAPNPRPNQPITVRGNYFDCPANTQIMNVDDPGARNITQLTVTDNNEIILDLEAGTQYNNVLYRLTNNGSAVIPAQDVYNVNQLTIPSLDHDNQFYCFTLNTANPCPANPVLSGNTLCSSTLTVTPLLSNRMNVEWQTSSMGGLQNFTLQKSPGAPLPVQAPAARQFTDPDVSCPGNYEYQLIANYPAGISISKRRSAQAISSLPPLPVNSASTIVDGSSVELQWLQPPGFTPTEYSVSKSSVQNIIGNSPDPQFIDDNFDASANLCYHISYDDACGNASVPGRNICPMNLSGRLDDTNAAVLSWPAYEGWNGSGNVDHYTIERYDDSGGLISTTDVASGILTYTDPEIVTSEQIVVYRVVAYPVDVAYIPSSSDYVRIIRSSRIAYPSAFVPGSSIPENATFRVFAREEYNAGFELQIFNRWGELLFHTTDMNEGWDGTYKGNKMPEGTYVFIARFIDQAGRTLKHSGNVVLLRK